MGFHLRRENKIIGTVFFCGNHKWTKKYDERKVYNTASDANADLITENPKYPGALIQEDD